MGKDKEGSLCGIHPHVYPGHCGNAVAPDAAGVYGDGGVVVLLLTGNVAGVDAYNCVSFLYESCYLCLETHLPAVELCVQHVGCAKAERVYAAVRYANRPY